MAHKSDEQVMIDKHRQWRLDPVSFVRDNFQVEPDDWQVDALRAFAVHQRIAMKACKGPGKTACLAWLIWNFLCCYPDSKVAATSISGDNLQDNLWSELSKWQKKSAWLDDRFMWNKTRITHKDRPETWFATARNWPRQADSNQQADTLAGLHADYILFVLDESGGIPSAVMATAEAALSTGKVMRLVQAGNPIDTSGPLYDACTKARSLWYVIEITGDPDSPVRSKRISIEWARQMIDQYGRDNPWVMVNVLGQFPPSAINSLLGPDDISKAMGRHLQPDQYSFARKRFGIDVARFGDDKTVIFPRQGLASFNPEVMRNARSEDIAAKVAFTWQEQSPDEAFIDDTGGWAAGVIDLLNKTQYQVIPVQFNGKAMDARYFNKRSEMYFLAAEWIKKGGVLPPIPELTEELTALTYWFDKGKMRVEEKDQVKVKIGRSPDYADAFVLTFAFPDHVVSSARMPQEKSGSKHHVADYDPLTLDW
jgi:phage terminase large subunit